MLINVCVFAVLIASSAAKDIPAELQGKWKVTREIPTKTISCWGSKEAKQLIGTEIEYSADSLRWKDRVARDPQVAVSSMTAEQFQREYSGGGSAGSQVTLKQLGIRSAATTLVVLTHPEIEPINDAAELPGDTVLFKGKDKIVFSVCNVYFEAHRKRGSNHKPATKE
jgi:hypothetical protein